MAEVPFAARVISGGAITIPSAGAGIVATGITRGAGETVFLTAALNRSGTFPQPVVLTFSDVLPTAATMHNALEADIIGVTLEWSDSLTFDVRWERINSVSGSLDLEWRVVGIVA